MINLIIAVTSDNGIGLADGTLPWKAPTDMARFKRLTTQKHVLMGRSTWETIPEKFRPLPWRHNIVLSRDPFYPVPPNVQLVDNLFATLQLYKNNPHMDVFVMGGAQVYDEVMAAGVVDRAYITIMRDTETYKIQQPTVFTKTPFANYHALLNGMCAGSKYKIELEETDEPIGEPMMTFVDLVRIS